MNELEMNEAIDFIEKAINAGNSDIVVNTEFGKLVIDVNYEDYGPNETVIVEDWNTAPVTDFNMTHRNCNIDYYVCITNPVSELNLHLLIIEAMYRVMIKCFLCVDIDHDIANAAVMIHRLEIEGKLLTVNMLYHDFLKHRINKITRHDSMVQYLVRQHVQTRFQNAKALIQNSSKLYHSAVHFGVYQDNADSKYTRQIFGLMIYIADEYGIDLRRSIIRASKKLEPEKDLVLEPVEILDVTVIK